MKKVALLVFVLFAFMGCGPQGESTTTNQEKTKLGEDRDEHGCIPSAGEIWSTLKQSCIQLFEVGKQLSSIEEDDGTTELSAYVILSDDDTQIELFLPNDKNSYILDQTEEAGVFENDMYKFNAMANGTLYIDGEKKYAAK